MVKKIQYFILLLSLASMAVGFKMVKKGGAGGIKIIVIDPGHGGKDPGCHGVTHKEKDIALAVALKLGKYLEEYYKDVKIIYTRTTDVFVELEDRAQIANKAKADLFISIHCNAAGKAVIIKDPKTGKKRKKMYKNKKGKLVPVETINPEPFGTETYVMGLKNEAGKMRVATRENSAIFLEDDYEKKYGGFDPESEESYIIMSNYTSAYVIQSANLAVKIQDEYTKKAGRIDKGVHRQSIWVLWRTAMPSILTEIGYLTNPLEETFLGSDVGQEYLAKALFRGVRKYKDEIDGTRKEYSDVFENQPALENENIKAGNQPYVRKNEEEDLDEDEKKPVEASLTKTISETGTKVEDGKSITIISLDSTQKIIKPIDTVVTALKIAEKFKADKKSNGDLKNTLNTKEVKAPAGVKEIENKEGVFFKVQFASSETQLNLKEEKYKVLNNPDYYKVGNTLKYTSGNYSKFKTAVIHQNILREKGFSDCFVVAFKNGNRIDLNEARKLSPP